MNKMGETEITEWLAFYQLEKEELKAEEERIKAEAESRT